MTEHLYAVLADIHANYAALLAVEADAQAAGKELGLTPEYLCLGDIVDYGPQPNQCVDWIVRRNPLVLLEGNHDHEAAKGDWSRPARIDERYWPITLWTRFELKRRYRQALASWPAQMAGPNSLGDFICFHGYPDDAVRDNGIDGAGRAAGALDLLARGGWQHGLCGHTHFQLLFERKKHDTGKNPRMVMACHENDTFRPSHKRVNEWHAFPDRMVLFNPGSVGQPRSHAEDRPGDARAAYALLHSDGRRVTRYQWRRVAYPIAETADLLEKLSWLDGPKQNGGENGGDITKNTARRAEVDPADPFYDDFSADEKAALRARFGETRDLMIRVLTQGR